MKLTILCRIALAALLFSVQPEVETASIECTASNALEQSKCLQKQLINVQNKLSEAVQAGSAVQHALDVFIKLQMSPTGNLESIKSCRSAPRTGMYHQWLDNFPAESVVQCEMSIYGGGWTVIQQRLDGSVDFNQNFQSYRGGFGQVSERTEFWLGLEAIYQLTKSGPCELAVELVDSKGRYFFALYSDFGVGDGSTQYMLNRLGSYDGTAGDGLREFAFRGKFATKDKDAWQTWDNAYFATKSGGGWWFTSSWKSNLNGWFGKGKGYDFYWDEVGGRLKFSRMLVRTRT